MVFSKADNEVSFKISHVKVLCLFLKSLGDINQSVKEGLTALTFHNPCQDLWNIFVEQFICKCRGLKQELILRLLEEGCFHN